MAFLLTRMPLYFMVFLLSCLHTLVFSPVTVAEQLVSSWGPWSDCSSQCKGDQKRTRQCVQSPSVKCEVELEQGRECGQPSWSSGCFSLAMTISLAGICAALLLAVIIIIILCRRNAKEKERLTHDSKNMADVIERRYDDSMSMSSSTRHFPSVGSFPEPLKEPEAIDLDNFAFDQESLNESIHEMAFTFGADEEYQPNAQKNEEKRLSLKVVSVTETQVIDREDGLRDAEKPPPLYSVVMKPEAKAQEAVEDVTL